MCCFFNKAYLRIPFDIIKKPKVILLYHCWNHVLFSFIVVKDAASHSTNYSLPRCYLSFSPTSTTPPPKKKKKHCRNGAANVTLTSLRPTVVAQKFGSSPCPVATTATPWQRGHRHWKMENERQNPEVLKQRVLIVVHSFYVSFYFHIITTVINMIIIIDIVSIIIMSSNLSLLLLWLSTLSSIFSLSLSLFSQYVHLLSCLKITAWLLRSCAVFLLLRGGRLYQ